MSIQDVIDRYAMEARIGAPNNVAADIAVQAARDVKTAELDRLYRFLVNNWTRRT